MSNAASELISEGFLDDYFTECAEHLSAVRGILLALEANSNEAHSNSAGLEELFRRFHTLKGISGMVGLQEAEMLAHEMESYLRALRKEEVGLTTSGVDRLIAGTNLLEQVIAAFRAEQPAPKTDDFITQFADLLSPVLPPLIDEKTVRPLWRCTFHPTAELSARGINVNYIRSHLQCLGELVQATPQVMPQGGVTFEFLVASNADAAAFADGANDGLICERETAQPLKASPTLNGNHPDSEAMSLLVAPSQVVRVNLSRLDELMRMVGELVITRARLVDHLQRVESNLPTEQWRALQETSLALERGLRDLCEGVTRARMVPIAEIFDRMPFVVRGLARESDKVVRLDLFGQRTEIDKYLVERMMDPLLHLVRNAVSHGLETTSERQAQGKPAEGRMTLRASTVGEMVVIEIEDDGRGMDADKIIAHAQAAGLSIDAANKEALLDTICAPGFSTRASADRASGRGIGMDVVKTTVQELGGTLGLDTTPGGGTRFTIELPLTLAIADALIINVGPQSFAVPQTSVREVIIVEPADIKTLENNELIAYRGGVLPLMRLSHFFGLAAQPREMQHVLVIGNGLGAMGIVVDRIVGQREIVVRAITDPLIKVPGIAGATELGDGRAVLILDMMALKKRKAGYRSRRIAF